MSRYHHKGAGGQIRRPRYAAINYLESLIEPGIYSGFYDIVQQDGALDINGNWCIAEGDQVVLLPQLLPNGTASDIVFKTPAQANTPDTTYLTYRRGIQLAKHTVVGSSTNPQGMNPAEIFILIGLFCWAVQKFFVITKPLTEAEILEHHKAFVGTMEIYV